MICHLTEIEIQSHLKEGNQTSRDLVVDCLVVCVCVCRGGGGGVADGCDVLSLSSHHPSHHSVLKDSL